MRNASSLGAIILAFVRLFPVMSLPENGVQIVPRRDRFIHTAVNVAVKKLQNLQHAALARAVVADKNGQRSQFDPTAVGDGLEVFDLDAAEHGVGPVLCELPELHLLAVGVEGLALHAFVHQREGAGDVLEFGNGEVVEAGEFIVEGSGDRLLRNSRQRCGG